jgi:hypothetical protein
MFIPIAFQSWSAYEIKLVAGQSLSQELKKLFVSGLVPPIGISSGERDFS